ncbi:MAG: ABC transporter permease subunit [Planctomycetes bacterium]|nr:ABC transporter permease subunit [Planctomycetota bacterium]
MHDIWVVTKREFRSYFLSPIAYVVGAIFLLYGSYEFFQFIFLEAGRSAEARMNTYFGQLPIYFLVLVPALSMRLWSEERKLGTLELLLTFPVRNGSLILGKFFGALLFLAVLLGLTLMYPITLTTLGNLDWGPVIGGYAGALLLGASYLALGMFLSSLSRDQIIALIVTVVALLLMVRLPAIATYFLPKSFVEPLMVLSPVTHFMSIARGVIDMADIVFYAAFVALFLFLNSIVLEYRKWVG